MAGGPVHILFERGCAEWVLRFRMSSTDLQDPEIMDSESHGIEDSPDSMDSGPRRGRDP